MFNRCVLPLSLGLATVSASANFRTRCFDTLCERDDQIGTIIEMQKRIGSIQTEMESAGMSVAEEQQTLEDLKKEAQKRAEQGSKPLSKKQRRLQYVNELLSHNSDLKKQSLIKVINNLNKCGVECTLSTQGKGSHITLSVDGKKHTISSKMQITHLRDALSDSGVQFSVIEDENGQSESDQIIQDQTLKVDELTQLLNSLGVDLAELEKEKQKLEEELTEQQESVEEVFEALIFSEAVSAASDVIIHRSFGRREMIWQIYEAVLADLPHFGPQLDFQRAVKKRLMCRSDDWGCLSLSYQFILNYSTLALEKKVQIYDTLGSLVSIGIIHARFMPVTPFFDNGAIQICALNLREFIDFPRQYDWRQLPTYMQSFEERHHRRPYLSEFKDIMNQLKIEEHPTFHQITFLLFNSMISIFEQTKKERLPKHEQILRFTQDNPNDEDWYTRMRKEKPNLNAISLDELMKISELYDRCNCKMAQAWFDLAFAFLMQMEKVDQNKADGLIEKMVDQTPSQKQDPRTRKPFDKRRKEYGSRLYNQAVSGFQSAYELGHYAEEHLNHMDRAERIYGDGWFKDKNFSQNNLNIAVSCAQLGQFQRAVRYYARVGHSTLVPRNFRMEFQRLGFDVKSKEVSRERQKWETMVKEQERRMRKERVRSLVIEADREIDRAKETWDERDELDLDKIEQNHQKLRKVRNEMKDCLECAIDHPDLLRQLKDKDELYQKCVAFKKGEHSPKKKKTQKRGKRGKH